MSESKTAAAPRQLRRLTREDPGVVTVNMRSSRILIFWSSHATLVPVEPGWYLHAASVAGRTSMTKGERTLDAPFELGDPQVRWQHARIDRVGGVDLVLEKGRRYVFYLTREQASREQLLRRHRPWPFRVRPPQSKSEFTVLALQAWPIQLEYHSPEDGSHAPKGQPRDLSLISFDSWEHESIADVESEWGQSVQNMVDMWAFRGLIDGGAMIDTSGSFEDWNLWCPGEEPAATPQNPYALPRPMMEIDPMGGKWHYVIPEKQVDPATGTERPWTAGALKKAMRNGRAAALTVGQMVMLGGDDFETPEEMTADVDRWKTSQNIMRVYWEARRWVEDRKKALVNGADIYCWQGYQHRHGVVDLVFELLMGNPDALATKETLNEMKRVGKGETETGAELSAQPSASLRGDGSWAREERRRLKYSFDDFMLRVRRVDAMVDFIRQASGASRYTEIQFLAQTLGSASQGKGGTFGWMQSRLPWLTYLHPQHDLTAAGFEQAEIQWFETQGIDDQLLQIVGTNGRYGDLALRNNTHFSEDGLNFRTFAKYHHKALEMVAKQGSTPDATHPIPARALFHTAFGCHFLTDAFSASHMRVPRKSLGAFSAKLMHDVDGLVGLWVYNYDDQYGPNIWYAFGDTYLHNKTVGHKQWKLLPVSGINPEWNLQNASSAVGSSLKQLHYQAHSLRQTGPTPSNSSGLNSMMQRILDSNGPTDRGGKEERTIDAVLQGAPPAPEGIHPPHLLNETLARGEAGMSGNVWERLKMSIDDRIRYLKKLVPIPLPAGSKAPVSLPDGFPSSVDQPVNIPPLFSKGGKLISGDDNPYDIATSQGNCLRGFTKYAGYSLRVNWGPFGDIWNDDEELRLNYDKYYFMTKFFKDVAGLDFLMDPSLLDVYDQLPKEKY
jgi:hypothetical protein